MQLPFAIDFPKYDLRITMEDGRRMIFDIIRKKAVALTPEEMVRQHILHYLIGEKQCPKSLVAVEMTLSYNTMSRRCDIVVYGRESKPLMIVECKAPDVKLNQQVFDQAARYNEVLQVPYLFITNGHECFCAKVDLEKGSYSFVQVVPDYGMLIL